MKTTNISKKETLNQKENNINEFIVSWTDSKGEMQEGPLSLLSFLIESYKVDIYKVSLVKITEDFFSFIQKTKEKKIQIASSFFSVGAQLIFYKSKALLPVHFDEDTESSQRLPKDLVRQLLLYRSFQEASQKLAHLIQNRQKLFSATNKSLTLLKENYSLSQINFMDIYNTYKNLIAKIKEKTSNNEFNIDKEKYTVQEKIELIESLLKEKKNFPF